MLYELRIYRAVPGRVGDLAKRFKDQTLGLFARHGLEVVFISQTEVGDDHINELVYVLRHPSYREMFDRWESFLADPDWAAVRAETEADGQLVVSVKRTIHSDAYFGG
jgi:NIPSNAP protein